MLMSTLVSTSSSKKLHGPINLTHRNIHALTTTAADTGIEVQLNLLSEIKVLLKFGKKRAVWLYGRLPALYSALETYKSREYQVDHSNNMILGDRYQVVAGVRADIFELTVSPKT